MGPGYTVVRVSSVYCLRNIANRSVSECVIVNGRYALRVTVLRHYYMHYIGLSAWRAIHVRSVCLLCRLINDCITSLLYAITIGLL